jgi:hypothetical protein
MTNEILARTKKKTNVGKKKLRGISPHITAS